MIIQKISEHRLNVQEPNSNFFKLLVEFLSKCNLKIEGGIDKHVSFTIRSEFEEVEVLYIQFYNVFYYENFMSELVTILRVTINNQ